MQTKTGFLYHELCMWHDAGNRCIFDNAGLYYQPKITFENPETKRRLKNLLDVSGVMETLQTIPAVPATIQDLLAFMNLNISPNYNKKVTVGLVMQVKELLFQKEHLK